uniref:Uncharacterized protein LOC111125117 n=1 Tax=Crassostrea virginica TaxID=6565 RepID=A0A8B8DBJ4_CRAVI|nr:uncharacterized protein LOC111125117 [Crassostrea virginica]
MMSRREVSNLYSVFVGHLSLSVTKGDLLDLFEGCGDVEDVFICDRSSASPYLYGFVRFREIESVYKAVKVLHRWPLKGNKIVVDIAKDTGDRIKREGEVNFRTDTLSTSTTPTAPLVRDRPPAQATSNIIQDVMHLGRLKESYASLSVDAKHQTGVFTGHKSLNVTDIEMFMEDVEQCSGQKCQSYVGEAASNVTADTVYQALLNSDDLDPAFGMKRANQFLSALKVVMGNMASFLKDHELMSAEAGDLFDLCTGKDGGETSGASSHSSHDMKKVYRDSGFESELEARFREPESLEKQQCSLFDNDEASSTNKEDLKLPQHATNPEQNMAQSEISDYSSLEHDAKQFDEIDHNNIDQISQRTARTSLKSDENIEAENHGSIDDIDTVDEACSSMMKDLKVELDESDMLVTHTSLVKQTGIEGSKDLKPNCNSSSSSYSTSSEKLARSNYYRPISPVSPDFSIISSSLHCSSTKPTSDSQHEIVESGHPPISPISEPLAVLEHPIAVSYSSHSPGLSAHQSKSPSAICDQVCSAETPSPYVPFKQVPFHTSSQHQVLHKSVSDSNVRNVHSHQHTRSLSQNEPASLTSNVSASANSRKLDLSELFGSCNGQKQEVREEKMTLNHIFSLCNGQKMELSTEQYKGLPIEVNLPEKHAPTGVQQEEFQRCLERVGRGRGLNLLKTLK